MTFDEEENAVRQLGELIGYTKLIAHADRLSGSRLQELCDLAADHRYSSEAIGIAFRNRFPPTDTGSVT